MKFDVSLFFILEIIQGSIILILKIMQESNFLSLKTMQWSSTLELHTNTSQGSIMNFTPKLDIDIVLQNMTCIFLIE